MLQIDHVYEFFYSTIFKDFTVYSLPNGVYQNKTIEEIKISDVHIFNWEDRYQKIFFIDQEPILNELASPYIELFKYCDSNKMSMDEFIELRKGDGLKFDMYPFPASPDIDLRRDSLQHCLKNPTAIVTSEKSNLIQEIAEKNNVELLYYFFHGFAASDWFRGFQTLNYNKQIVKNYKNDYVTFNRIIADDRSYRCLLISRLIEKNLLHKGQVSFGLDSSTRSWREEVISNNTKLSKEAIAHINTHLPSIDTKLIIDSEYVQGYASSDIPRHINDSFWHVVTETVFYYDKLHLTEKIFKPIVMKQPFILLAGTENLKYLRSYGFKTFDGIIDETYDTQKDPDIRIWAAVNQLSWYCSLSEKDKLDVMRAVEPIVEYNFRHFYGEFKHIIASELLENCKNLFKKIGYDDNTIAYYDIYKTLVN
jgi:hypothetical protein